MKELICIACPMGCHLEIDDELNVSGNLCPRGASYGKKEMTAPTRMICSTVQCQGGLHPRLPVKTDAEIPKELIFPIIRTLDGLVVKCPVSVGDIILSDVLGTGVNIVATRDMN